jgi:hypothetical protein
MLHPVRRSSVRPLLACLALGLLACLVGSPALRADPLPPDYWRLPIPPQGEAPADWSPAERSLRPEACGTCHAEQYEAWRMSRHAHAFSPGLVGQLLTFDPSETALCLGCHAPLAEQRSAFLDRRGAGDQVTADAGNSCAACHVRAHRRYGPPAAPDDQQPMAGTVHGGAVLSGDFERSEFCAACHQFPVSAAVNGKPLENTVAEWQASPFAQQGKTCQACHMPGRQHLWRGIHDPAMVAAGLTPIIAATDERVLFSLRSSNIGHAFPTYVTPKAAMHAVLLDDDGTPVEGGAATRLIQRVVEYGDQGWIERSDTRLAPGETATLSLPWGRYRRARIWLEIAPEDYYHAHVFPRLLAGLDPGSPATQELARADAGAAASGYRLFETDLVRPR